MRKHILIFILVITAISFVSINITHRPVAVIYDPLSGEHGSSPIGAILSNAGYDVTIYNDQDATVNSFKSLSEKTNLLVLRVHSSIHHGNIWVFTSEPYSNEKHSIDQLVDNVHKAKTHPDGTYLFALSSGFFSDYVPELNGTQVLVLGCDAAASDDLANVFLEKGASSFIGWDGPVSIDHTDAVFVKIIEQITLGASAETAAEIALGEYGCDPHFKSRLICIKQ